MATAVLDHAPAKGRAAVVSWISGGIAVLLTALLGVAAAAQLRAVAALIGATWLGPAARAWLR